MIDDLSTYLDELRASIDEMNVTMVTAVQVSNPHRQPIDIGSSWDPLIVNVDYMS